MKRYSIVCYLENETKQKVRDLQQKLFEITGSRACLDDWMPHITLGDGPEVSELELEKLEQEIKKLADVQNSFSILSAEFSGRTDRKGGNGENTTPYILWINIVVKDMFTKLIVDIESITNHYNVWYQKPFPYIPHITLAFRDLSEAGHKKGRQYLESVQFNEKIIVSHIALVERLEDSDVEYKRFYFK